MAQLIEGLKSHPKQSERWRLAVTKQRVASTLLFLGRPLSELKNVALGCAQTLLCEQPPETGKACGTCSSCRRVELRGHESVLLIEPENGHIKVDQASEILQFLKFNPLSKVQVVIVSEAQTLNPMSGNALLKIFEEPPKQCHIILTAPTLLSVLPTLRSRSQVWRWMESRSPIEAQAEHTGVLHAWLRGESVEWDADLKDQDTVEEVISQWLNAAKDILLQHQDLEFTQAQQLYEMIHQFHRDLKTNVDRSLAVEYFRNKMSALEISV